MAGTRDRDSLLTSPSAANGLINMMAGFGWCPTPHPHRSPSCAAATTLGVCLSPSSALPRSRPNGPSRSQAARAGASLPGGRGRGETRAAFHGSSTLPNDSAHTGERIKRRHTPLQFLVTESSRLYFFFFFFRYTMKTGSPAWIWGGVHHG